MSKRALVILLILISHFSFGQRKPVFKSIDLGFDYLKLATLAFPDEKKYEGIAALNFGFGLSIDGEYGYTNKSPKDFYKNGTYSFEGTYYRIGLGYNFPVGETSTLGFGARYAQSKFEDFTAYTIKSIAFDDYYETTGKRTGLEAQWVELVLKSEAGLKKVKNLKLGLFIRLKFVDPIKQEDEYFPVQAIPGYGLTKGNTSAAANLFIKYSIPLSK